MTRSTRLVPIVVAVIAGALTACSSSGSPKHPSTPAPTRSATAVSSGVPAVDPIAPVSLPAGLGGADPCAHSSSALTAASAYVGVAQLGQTALAQKCVQGGVVPASVTAMLTASSVSGYFVPSGPTTRPTIEFRRVDMSQTVRVTVITAGSGYAVTAVAFGR